MSAKTSEEGFLQPQDLNRLSPLRDQIYRLLRAAIVNGRLKPGQPIDELGIAGRLKISRTPVREAVKKLSDEGLIHVIAQSGTYVASIDRKQLEEAYVIRTALELESVSRAALTITERHIQDLEDIVDGIARAFERRAFDEVVARDDDFHRYIADINGLSMLWRAVDISKAQMDRCSYLSATTPSMGSLATVEHKAIIRALKTRQKHKALVAMRTHLDNSLRTALSLLDTASHPSPVGSRPPRR